jgi:hypothetical protein
VHPGWYDVSGTSTAVGVPVAGRVRVEVTGR